jgi:hypothetical protein
VANLHGAAEPEQCFLIDFISCKQFGGNEDVCKLDVTVDDVLGDRLQQTRTTEHVLKSRTRSGKDPSDRSNSIGMLPKMG